MEIFTTLLMQLLPLYLTIVLGFLAGRFLQIEGRAIGVLVMYIVVPIVVFDAVASLDISLEILALPLLLFSICTVACFLFLWIGKRVWSDAKANVLALMVSNGNLGYFGVPVAIMLFDERAVNIYITMLVGSVLFESTVGFYVTAKGHHTAREALVKVLRLPLLYGFILGGIFGASGVALPAIFDDFAQNLRGTYIILGMMIIGLGIAANERMAFNVPFIGLAFTARFVAWPLLAFGFIALDRHFLQLFDSAVHDALMLMSFVPIAANAVVIATVLKVFPEKVATTVLLSTLFALVYVPIMVTLFLR